MCVIHMYNVCTLFYLIVQCGLQGGALIILYINGQTNLHYTGDDLLFVTNIGCYNEIRKCIFFSICVIKLISELHFFLYSLKYKQ